MKEILYLECNEGLSGDMTVASLLDLGADKSGLLNTLKELNIDGYSIEVSDFMNRSLKTTRFSVHLDHNEHPDHADHNDHHSHDHDHGISHTHRNINDIKQILSGLSDENVKNTSLKIFNIVAEAEAKVHGKDINDIHFHEVGAVDSIVDIVSAAYCINNLGFAEIALKSITEGSGTVESAHGTLSVPVPAVLEIVKNYNLPLNFSKLGGERITPTGAAIAAALWNGQTLPENAAIKAVGYASGHRKYENISILRSMILECAEGNSSSVYVLETNIDDSPGEALGLALEHLLSSGARDAFITPIIMKKNRPAFLLSVICDEEKIETLEDIIFRDTSTIGIRRHKIERRILDRTIRTVETEYGPADVKICINKGETYCYPEYESIKTLCERSGLSYHKISALIVDTYLKNQN